MTDLGPLLNPESIAVVGASPRGNRGLQIIQNLQRFGSAARIYPVHPREPVVGGLRAYPDLESLPETVEFVAISLDAESSVDVLERSVKAGAKAGLIVASGFGEGGMGRERRERVVEVVNASGFLLCGPNCYGVINAGAGFAAYSGQVVSPFTPGRVAVVMQSGALTHSLTDSAVGRGLALSHLITTGNELSVTLGRYIRALVEDDGVDVIGVFIESLRDVEEFAQACVEARAKGKPVVALVVGRSELGKRAAVAHTGAITGGAVAMSGFLRRCGVVQTTSLDEFRETLLMFGTAAAPTAGGVAMTSISGGGSGLLADLAEDLDLALPTLQPGTVGRLRDVLPDFATITNPLDVTGAAVEEPEMSGAAMAALREDAGVGLVVLALNVACGSTGQEDVYRDQVRQLAGLADDGGTPMVVISLTSGPVDEVLLAELGNHGVVMLTGAVPALQAIGSWMSWNRSEAAAPYRRNMPGPVVDLGEPEVLTGLPAMQLLREAGMPIPDYYSSRDAADVAGGWDGLQPPVVLKVEAAGLAHKTEIGGVAMGIMRPDDLEEAAREMLDEIGRSGHDVTVDGFLVQAQVTTPSVECLVGVVRDPQVGLTLSVVPGGVLAELGGRAVSTPVPASRSDVEFLIDASPLGRLLAGYRGAPRADRHALVDLVLRFGDLVSRCGPAVAAAEINPVLVLPEGHGAVAVDALFVKGA